MQGELHEQKQIFIADSNGETVEVRELMESRYIDDQQLAIDALKGWCKVQEQITEPPEGKEHFDRHHWLNKKAGKGQPYAQYRQRPENITKLRRDIHERVERIFGWVSKPYMHEVKLYLKPERAVA